MKNILLVNRNKNNNQDDNSSFNVLNNNRMSDNNGNNDTESSISNCHIQSNNRNDDIESNDNDNVLNRIEDDDVTLWDVVMDDKYLMLFLKINGFIYKADERDTLSLRILTRIWQSLLLVFGGLGLCWLVFDIGGYHIVSLFQQYTTPNSVTSTEVFITFGDVLADFLVPLLQACSLFYGIYNVTKQMKQQVNRLVTKNLLISCKRDALIFFISMTLLIIIINPLDISHSKYESSFVGKENLKKTFGEPTYSLFVLSHVSILIFNMAITCYLSVVMLFMSLTINSIILKQQSIIDSVEENRLSPALYMLQKEKIMGLQNESYYSSQLMTLSACLNVFLFLFRLWYFHYQYSTYSNQGYTYETMIIDYFKLLPFLLKGTFNPNFTVTKSLTLNYRDSVFLLYNA